MQIVNMQMTQKLIEPHNSHELSTGEADFAAPCLHKVTIGAYFKHLMMYRDDHLVNIHTFANCSEHRNEVACTPGRQHLHTSATSDAQLTVQELKDMVGSDGEAFSNRVILHCGAQVPTGSSDVVNL